MYSLGGSNLHLRRRAKSFCLTRALFFANRGAAIAGAAITLVVPSSSAALSLREAAYQGNIAKIDLLVKNGQNVNQWKPELGTPLYDAIRSEQPRAVHELVALGADVNWKPMGRDGKISPPYTPLYYAASRGYDSVPEDVEIVKELVNAGADPNGVNSFSPLLAAIKKNSTDISRVMIQNDRIDSDVAIDALDEAATNSNVIIFDELLHIGAKPHNSTTLKEGTLFAAIRGGSTQLVTETLKAGVAPGDSYNQTTALAFAAEFGRPEIVDLLLRRGALDKPDANGLYAVHNAARKFQFDIAAELLDISDPNPLYQSDIPSTSRYRDQSFLKEQLQDPIPGVIALANLYIVKGDKAIDRDDAAVCSVNFQRSYLLWKKSEAHFDDVAKQFAVYSVAMQLGKDVAIIGGTAGVMVLSSTIHSSLGLGGPGVPMSTIALSGAISGSEQLLFQAAFPKPSSFSPEYVEGLERHPEMLKAMYADRREVSRRFAEMGDTAEKCCAQPPAQGIKSCYADFSKALTSKKR